jgi:prepilin-type N-terminal cleavage/methylation domain-containing protein/prepilin-type processing-associated H-X9-DG protein
VTQVDVSHFKTSWRSPGRRGAFTLVELLVTIAIIALLGALLLPALSGAKYHAKNATCRNNLRQISVALALYTTTHGFFPPARGFLPPGSAPAPDLEWMSYLDLTKTYLTPQGSEINFSPEGMLGGVFRCPFDRGRIVTVFEISLGQLGAPIRLATRLPGSYGYNAWSITVGPGENSLGLAGTHDFQTKITTPTRDTAVAAPSEMIALGDDFSRSINPAYDGFISLPHMNIAPAVHSAVNLVKGSKSEPPPKKQPTFVSHRGRANRAFVDGHLEAEDMRRPFKATDTELRRWTKDHLPHRELLRD